MRRSTGWAVALVAATFAGPARAQSVVAVHPTKVEQTMSGFGAGIDGSAMAAAFEMLNETDRRRANSKLSTF